MSQGMTISCYVGADPLAAWLKMSQMIKPGRD